ncbi:hypothetical protein WJX77_012419 [Trebouxia sp. C0004]
MNTGGLTHPRPRTSETEGLAAHSGNPLVEDVQDEATDHGNSGNAWGTYLQRTLHQANQKKLPVALGLVLVVLVLLSLPGTPGLPLRGSDKIDTEDRVYDSMQEGNHTLGETHLPLGKGGTSVGGTGPRFNISTVKAVFLNALDTGKNASAPAQGPRQEPAICPTLVVPKDYFPDGEGPRTGNPESLLVRSPKSVEKPQKERVLILAANSGGSCSLRLGDYYNFLSLLDKLQYGNVHGYDVLLGLGNVDDELRKTWNKVAWMQKALNETAREDAEWILWMDLDTVAVESDIAFPLADYEGKDLVLWIQPDLVLQGDAFQLNTGVMLMRNTDWSRQFIGDVARLGRMHVNHWQLMDEVFQEELTTHFDSGLFDQNAMAFLMKRYQESVMPHVFAADRVFRINAFWRDYLGVDFSRLHELDDSILFNHFSGCSMCAGKDNNEDLDLCQSEFQRTFERANCTYRQMNQTSSSSYVSTWMLSNLTRPGCRSQCTTVACCPKGRSLMVRLCLGLSIIASQSCTSDLPFVEVLDAVNTGLGSTQSP